MASLDKIVELTKKVDEIMRVAEAIDVLANLVVNMKLQRQSWKEEKELQNLKLKLLKWKSDL